VCEHGLYTHALSTRLGCERQELGGRQGFYIVYSTFLTLCLDIAINEGEGYYLGIKLLKPALESLLLYFQHWKLGDSL